MKKLTMFFFSIVFFASCVKDKQTLLSTKENPGKNKANLSADDWVFVTNQTNNNIEIYDPALNWDTSSNALKWSWMPKAGSTGNGYSTYAVGKWVRPNDFKVRYISAWGGNYLCAVGGGGLATIAAYPSGQKKWAYYIDFNNSTSNPHGCELLPNGNIAVAATKKDSVLVFASSTPGPSGNDNTFRRGVRLVGAHGVLWDPTINRLWAIGNDHVLALEISGTAANPIVSEDVPRRGYLVNGGASLYGHDLSRDLNDNNILWVSTNGGVYSFNKSTKMFSAAPGGVNKSFVKGISRQNSGTFVITRKDAAKTNPPAGSATIEWCTLYVDFYSSAGTFLYYKTKTGQQFYKAKIFRTPY